MHAEPIAPLSREEWREAMLSTVSSDDAVLASAETFDPSNAD